MSRAHERFREVLGQPDHEYRIVALWSEVMKALDAALEVEREELQAEIERQNDRDVMDSMYNLGGSFVKALAEVASRADHINLARLKAAFPDYWEEYRRLAALKQEKSGK